MREWAHNQAAAKLLSWSADADGVERFSMTPEAVAVLSDPDHPAFGMGMFHRLPQTMQTLEPIAESFRTGIGLDYDAFGPEGAAGIERSFGPWYRNFLVPVALPALDGVVPRLEDGREGDRHRLRRRHRGAHDGRGSTRSRRSTATTSPSTRWRGPRRRVLRRGSRTRGSTTRGATRSRATGRSTS